MQQKTYAANLSPQSVWWIQRTGCFTLLNSDKYTRALKWIPCYPVGIQLFLVQFRLPLLNHWLLKWLCLKMLYTPRWLHRKNPDSTLFYATHLFWTQRCQSRRPTMSLSDPRRHSAHSAVEWSAQAVVRIPRDPSRGSQLQRGRK
jgi:hypothetical protein